ncbi:MAG: FimV family protein [Thiohalomonadaceae bacterium]
MKKISLAIATLLATSQLHALGLGEARLHSHLGDPLQVSIPVYLSDTEWQQLEQLRASVGDRAMFERMQLEYHLDLAGMEVSVVRQGSELQLLLRSRERIYEPMVEFPLDVRLGGNRVARSFTLLLDPPGTPLSTAPASPPTSTSRPAPVTTTARTPSSTTTPAPATPRPAIAPAEIQPRMQDGRYGPIAVNQTLGDVAVAMRPAGASINQTLVALWQANPKAFINNNMHRLMAGSTLNLPSPEQVLAIDTAMANREVNEQFQNMRSGTVVARTVTKAATTPASTVVEEKSPEPIQDERTRPEATVAEGPRLSLLEPSSLEQIPPAFREEVSMLGSQLRALDDENLELRNRIGDLEQHISTLSQQMLILAENTVALSGAESERISRMLAQLEEEQSNTQIDNALALPADAATADSGSAEAALGVLDRDMQELTKAQDTKRPWLHYALFGGLAILTLGVGVIWYRRLRQRERYKEVMYRL